MLWIDYSDTRNRINSLDGHEILYYRCKCAACERCWFDPIEGVCLCGGPFSGYAVEEPDLDAPKDGAEAPGSVVAAPGSDSK